MPERRDYLLRIIEQMSRVLARVRMLTAGGEVAKAQDELRAVVRQAGLDLDMVKRMSVETLLPLLTSGPAPDPGRCLLVAEVLLAEADRLEAAGSSEDVARLRAKAVVLYRTARPHVGRDDQHVIDERIVSVTNGATE
jgi:hypothetical protein